METIKLEYSKPLIKRAIRSFWWRQVGPLFLAATVAMAGFFVYLLLEGDRSWVVGLVGGTVCIAITTMVASYVVHLRRSLSKLGLMGTPEATLELGSNRFRISSGAGISEIEWSLIKQVWRFDEVWLLHFNVGEYFTLPTKHITQESEDFMLRKLEQVGATIV